MLRLFHPYLNLRHHVPSRWKWLIATTVVVLAASLAGWLVLHKNGQHLSAFGKIWQLYSFKPEVTATAYNSLKANATIIWLSGLDEHLSEFSDIWKVYSFKPEVIPTVYNSPQADATIIWLSGVDEHFSEFSQIWQLYSFKPEVTAIAYDSPLAGATIIWLSGMDSNGNSHGSTSF